MSSEEKYVSAVQTKERLRRARELLEPLVSGNGKQFGFELNQFLSWLSAEEARIEAEYGKTMQNL